MKLSPSRCGAKTDKDAADRYLSFEGIDLEANMADVLGHLRRHFAAGRGNAFWDRFEERLAAADSGEGASDRLLLMHAHVYYMRELFEEYEDEEALAALARLEEQCL